MYNIQHNHPIIIKGGMDEFSWALCSDNAIRHNKQVLHSIDTKDGSEPNIPRESDIIGISYDHIQLKFYVNGEEIDFPVSNVRGTLYPVLYGK